MYVEFFLLLAVMGSRFRGLQNTLLSVIGLSGATIIYVLWWQYIFKLASNAEVSVQSLPHFLFLLGANVLDLGIALLIAGLIILNIRDAAGSLVDGPA
jgi:hypothetical protein